jgi:CheY-like chemotaxis protein
VGKHLLDVEISDTGCGVSKETAAVLFRKFEQGGFHRGSGVGLHISQHIAALMGSKIQIQSPYRSQRSMSDLGSGTCERQCCTGARLYFTVPVCVTSPETFKNDTSGVSTSDISNLLGGEDDSAMPTNSNANGTDNENSTMGGGSEGGESGESGGGGGGGGTKSRGSSKVRVLTSLSVLLVEDDPMNQIIMQAKLQEIRSLAANGSSSSGESGGGARFGAECRVDCVTVDTAEKAIELLAKEVAAAQFAPTPRFDVVCMDQHLENAGGVLTGIEAVRELRGKGYVQPIIMCSGNCNAQDSDGYLDSGASWVWPKPYPTTVQMASDLSGLLSATNSELAAEVRSPLGRAATEASAARGQPARQPIAKPQRHVFI